jgi:AcrR family transcriptional regulator
VSSLRAVGDGDARPPARRRMARGERQSLILRHAAEMFGSRGYHNVSMEDVAEHAGISKALIYQHFESKDQLYLAVLRQFQGEVRQMVLHSWGATGTPEEKMWNGVLAFFQFVDRNRTAWGVLYRDSVAIEGVIHRGMQVMRAEIAERVGLVLEQEMIAADVDRAILRNASASAHALVGACEALADYWLDHPEESPITLATIAMNMAWLGFGQVVAGQLWQPPLDAISGDNGAAEETFEDDPPEVL